MYRVGQKTGPFFRVDNFATVCGTKARNISKVSKFCLEQKSETCMSVSFDILCLICISRHYPSNYAVFNNNTRILFNFHSTRSETTTIISNNDQPRRELNMGALCLDNHHHSSVFWQLIDRSVGRCLSVCQFTSLISTFN